RDAAPGLAGRDRLAQPVRRIEPESLRDLVPWPAEACGRAGADQPAKLVRAEREMAVGIHLPDEAQRMTLRCRRRASLLIALRFLVLRFLVARLFGFGGCF